MEYLDLTIEELHACYLRKEVTPLEVTKMAIAKAKHDTNNAFETICEAEALAFAESLKEPEQDNVFWGIPYVAKDNFSTKGILTTASSNILKDYVPVFDATVIEKLKQKKAVLIGKTTLDELAMGGTGTTGHKGKTFNPYDPTHTYMIGGSSCGSAAAVAAGIVPFALGSDTGDSVRKPASYAGLVGMKPTWGRISRYGLFPFAPSLDHVAYFTRSVEDSASALELLSGEDNLDATSTKKIPENYRKLLDTISIKGKKLAVLKPVIDAVQDPIVRDAFQTSLFVLKEQGVIVDEIDFDPSLLEMILPTYMILSCAEATSNNANLDGIKFGPRQGNETSYQEVMKLARTVGFGELIKRRFVIGSYSLYKENQAELFLRAQKARRLIVDAIQTVLQKYDAIYLPAVGTQKSAFHATTNRLANAYLIAENHLAIANFAGLPSITLPIGLTNDFPIGGNFTTRAYEEEIAFAFALAVEKAQPFKNLQAGKVIK